MLANRRHTSLGRFSVVFSGYCGHPQPIVLGHSWAQLSGTIICGPFKGRSLDNFRSPGIGAILFSPPPRSLPPCTHECF
ncbi:hypothetical protein LshimejAT787_1000110 [Lyophyllum shimeji]|uniref:Uncharacterized protein n=1 Tax=Lyophyllum shimeji TaxID=47721 RepID=A0A9P3USP6_LYOSH|nr:hypothetical protein LshimejAT787_1000110 [Lyophyllum shimeji]